MVTVSLRKGRAIPCASCMTIDNCKEYTFSATGINGMTISLCDSCQTETTLGKNHVNTNCFNATEEKRLETLLKTAGYMAKIEKEITKESRK